jgi:hypothetical protein
MGEDLPFDYGTCGGLGHLMPLSGDTSGSPSVEGRPRARRRLARGALNTRARWTLVRGALDPRVRRRWMRRQGPSLDGPERLLGRGRPWEIAHVLSLVSPWGF